MVTLLKSGWGYTKGIRRYLIGLYVLNLLISLALAWVIGDAIARSVGKSTVAYELVDRFAPLWYQEFSQQATGLLKSFQPSISGIGGILDGLEGLLTGHPFRAFPGLLALGITYILLWVVFAAGSIGKMASEGELHFWEAIGKYAIRFAALTALAGIGYYLILGQLLPFLSETIKHITRDVTDARIIFYWTVLKYLVVWTLAGWIFFALDMARIVTVQRHRRMVPLAFVEGMFWVVRHPVKILTLAIFWLFLGGLGMVVYGFIAPGAQGGSLGVILATFLVGQLYLWYRMVLRLWLWGSEIALRKTLASTALDH